MGEYLKLYGPAVGNLAVTVGVYFHLKSKIAEINPSTPKLDDIYERLDKIDAAFKQLIPVVQQLDKAMKILHSKGYLNDSPPEGGPEKPKEEPKDKPLPKSKKAKAKTISQPEVSKDIEDELDAILDMETEAHDIELETEAASEASAEVKPAAKKRAKKSFKR